LTPFYNRSPIFPGFYGKIQPLIRDRPYKVQMVKEINIFISQNIYFLVRKKKKTWVEAHFSLR
jgi:hypothetical protein